MSFRLFKKETMEVDWGTNKPSLSEEQIKLGCLLRIADATEVMAQSYAALIEERNLFKNRYEDAEVKIHTLKRSIRSLKGEITKLKK